MEIILYVEDDENDVIFMRQAWKKTGVLNPLKVVTDGEQAMKYLSGEGQYANRQEFPVPRLVLLDLKLPKVNGLEVLRLMKGDPHLRTIPVVMVTSSAEDPDIKAAYDLGANGYVIKPVQFDAFMEAMSHLGIYWLMVNHPMK